MKRCEICGHIAQDTDATCRQCGEATFAQVAPVASQVERRSAAPIPPPRVANQKHRR